MSVFGFPSTATTNGHFGTGFTNTLSIAEEDCTLEIICETVDKILACCQAVLNGVGAIPTSSPFEITVIKQAVEAQDKKFDAITSAILDLRRELLRGNRDIGR